MDGPSAGERRRGGKGEGQLQLIRRHDDMYLLEDVSSERLICFGVGT